MKQKLLYGLLCFVCGCVFMLLDQFVIVKDKQTENKPMITFDDLMVVPYSDDVFNENEQENNDLYLTFHEEKFTIKQGDEFDYAGAIKKQMDPLEASHQSAMIISQKGNTL